MITSKQIDLLENTEPSPQCAVGCLQDSQSAERKLPLGAVQIQAQVLGSVLEVEMKQSFRNTYDTPLEAVYIFPLPGAAAVYQFELKIAERIVNGQVQERQAARTQYKEALEQGHRAALMEQERDDVYTLQVGNIPAGETVDICLKYVQQLDYRAEGLYECRLPMVIAPRYIPGDLSAADSRAGQGVESDTQIVGDASRISPPRLMPGFDPEIDFKLELCLHAGEGISELICSQHATRTQLQSDKIKITLAQQEALNRDFVLRWRTATVEQAQHTLYYASGTEADQGVGLIELQAPAPAFLQNQKREVLFLLDRSGSMGTYKMAAAAQACERLLNSLSPTDAFAIQAFDNRLQWLENKENDNQRWFAANNQGKDQGRRFLQGIDSRGGTELYDSISAGLKIFSSESTSLPVIVLLTDGQVGDESRILKKIQTEMGQALVHTIGIDTAVNDSFLKRLSQLGGGSHLSVSPKEDLSEALETIASEIGFPVLSNIKLNLAQLTPAPIPNLYAGRSLSLFFKGPCPEQLSLQAEESDSPQTIVIKSVDFPALAQLWAQSRIQQLEDRFRLADQSDKADLKTEMIQISCSEQILCRLTAWLAIDKQAVIKDSEQSRQVVQPVALPADWQESPALGVPPSMPMASAVFSAPMDPYLEAPRAGLAAPESAQRSKKRAKAPEKELLKSKAKPSRGQNWLQQKSHDLLGGSSSTAIPAPPSPASPAPLAAKPSQSRELISSQISEAIISLIQELLKSLSEIIDQLKQSQDQTPEFTQLKQLSQDLKEALINAEQAEHLPHTQRLLRQENKQLLQALSAGQIQGLSPLLKRITSQIEQVKTELQQMLQQSSLTRNESSPAWEQSI